MEQLSKCFGAFQAQSLQDMAVQVLTLGLQAFRNVHDSRADTGYEHSQVIQTARVFGRHIVGNTETIASRLAAKMKTLQNGFAIRRQDLKGLIVGMTGEEFENRLGSDFRRFQDYLLNPPD